MVSRYSQTRGATLFLTLALWSCGALATGDGLASGSVSEKIRYRFEALQSGFPVSAAQQPLLARNALHQFYLNRRFELAWFAGDQLRPEARDLLRTVDRSAGEGLQPTDYHQQAIATLIGDLSPSSTLAARIDLDLLLSDAFLLLGSHILAGKVNPITIEPEWSADRDGLDMAPLLDQALEAGSVEAMLDTLRPSQPGYDRLREERKRIRKLQDGAEWAPIAAGPLIHPGDNDPRLAQVRKRLIHLGDHAPTDGENATPGANSAEGSTYNVELLAAVSRFQRRHGLEPDGVIGQGTLDALNLSLAERLQQINLNMERWRWLPEQLGSPHLMVNMAGSEVQAVVDRQPIARRSLSVGRECNQAPVFSDEIRYLVFNPSWSLPPALAAQDGLAEFADPARLQQLGFSVYHGWGTARHPVDPNTVDWSTALAADSTYQFVQPPGPGNVLGKVKIVFPNRFNVYLHDTPAAVNASADDLPFAYGCVRIEEPMDLVDLLLGEAQGWSRKSDRNGDPLKSRTLYLKEPVKVHIQYLTNWADEQGILQVREDIFNRDAALAEALAQPPG